MTKWIIVTSIKLSQIEKEIQWIDSTCTYIKRTLDDGTLSFLKTTIKLEICYLKHNLSHTRLMRIGQVLMITYLEQKYKCKNYTLYQIEEKRFLIQCNKFAKQKEEVRIIWTSFTQSTHNYLLICMISKKLLWILNRNQFNKLNSQWSK